MSDATALFAVHIVWAVVFFSLGVFLMIRGDRMTAVRRAFCWSRFSGDAAASGWDARVRSAIERRQIAEGPPLPIGRWTGAASMLLSLACAFTSTPVAVLYAILCLLIAMVGAAALQQLRNTQQKRVAVLTSRTPGKVLPPFWFVLAVLSAVSILPFTEHPQWGFATVAVCMSSLATTFVAWRLTHLGAILTGEDVPAEQFVDDRVRSHRVSTILLLALIQPFVFTTQMPDSFGSYAQVAVGISAVIMLAFGVLHVRAQRQAARIA
jgi:hypothetical protein